MGSAAGAGERGAVLIAIHYLVNLPWLCFVAMGGGRAGDALRATALMRWVEGLPGTLFAGLAARLVVESGRGR